MTSLVRFPAGAAPCLLAFVSILHKKHLGLLVGLSMNLVALFTTTPGETQIEGKRFETIPPSRRTCTRATHRRLALEVI